MSAYIQSYINTGQGSEPARNFPVYVPANISIITGYYASDYSLIDVSTDVNISIIDAPSSNSYRLDPNNINYFYLLQTGSYTFQIDYTDPNVMTTFTDLISVVVINPLTLPSETDVYNLVKRSEPAGVYSQFQTYYDIEGNLIVGNDYADVTSTSNVFNNLYSDMTTVYQNLLPSGGSVDWELTLNNTDGLISYQAYSNIILEMLYSLLVNNTGNKFDVSFFLSKYIWYRTNKTVQCWVYIQEVTSLNYFFWILGTSFLGVNTFLNSTSLTPYQVGIYFIPVAPNSISASLQLELTNLVKRILPYGYTDLTYFDKTLSDLGLVQSIGQTYKSDPRLGQFALLFISTDVNQAEAYVNPFAPQNLVSIAMYPISGTNFEARSYNSYQIIGTYLNGATQDITNQTGVFSSNTSVLVVSALGTLYAVGNGSATLKFSYGTLFGYNTYTVTSLASWILDQSALDYTTILAGVPVAGWVLDSSALDETTPL